MADVSFAVAATENANSCSQISEGEMIPMPPSLGGSDRRVLSSFVTCLPSVSAGMRRLEIASSSGLRSSAISGIVRR